MFNVCVLEREIVLKVLPFARKTNGRVCIYMESKFSHCACSLCAPFNVLVTVHCRRLGVRSGFRRSDEPHLLFPLGTY